MELKNYKRISTGSEYRDVVQTANDEPRFRQNGHELQFESANSDYLEVNAQSNWINLSDVDFKVLFYVGNTSSNTRCLLSDGAFNNSNTGLVRFNITPNGYNLNVLFTDINNTNAVNLDYNLGGAGLYLIEFENLQLKVNGTTINTYTEQSINVTSTSYKLTLSKLSNASLFYSDFKYHEIEINTETFNPTEINSNAQIVGSLGTVATVNTSHASGNSYILGTVFQKSSFALVGNGTTQKIVGHLGTELTLTSTPLEGGFTLDGVIYNLTEGLGNEIKSTTGETATIQGYTGTGLNFGGWQKGNSVDGWNPYTIV